jgi:hypothetical protein
MHDKLAISKHLAEILQDWRESRDDFPANTCTGLHWPVPFFGNPATAIVATVGVNPSSGEFRANRNWNTVQKTVYWKRRLKNYFNLPTPPHEWFGPWRFGLPLCPSASNAKRSRWPAVFTRSAHAKKKIGRG